MNNQYELYHYGVPGMRWGVRKAKSIKSGAQKLGRKMKGETEEQAAAKKAQKRDVKNRRVMSDADLKKKIDRIKMERELKNITDEQLSPGKTATKKILGSAASKVALVALTGGALYLANVAMKRHGANSAAKNAAKEAAKQAGQKKYTYNKKKMKDFVDWNQAADWTFQKPKFK